MKYLKPEKMLEGGGVGRVQFPPITTLTTTYLWDLAISPRGMPAITMNCTALAQRGKII